MEKKNKAKNVLIVDSSIRNSKYSTETEKLPQRYDYNWRGECSFCTIPITHLAYQISIFTDQDDFEEPKNYWQFCTKAHMLLALKKMRIS